MNISRTWIATLGRNAAIAAVVLICLVVGSPVGRQIAKGPQDLHCRLPIVGPERVGFISFPSGQFTPDPAYEQNTYGVVYDAGLQRWVNAGYSTGYRALSPDGHDLAVLDAGPHFDGPRGAFTRGYTTVTTIDLQDGRSRDAGRIEATAGLIAVAPNGLYVAVRPSGNRSDLVAPGVYLYELTRHTLQRIGPEGAAPALGGYWSWVTEGSIWGSFQWANPPASDVVKMDLQSGLVSDWYTPPDRMETTIVGLTDEGKPIVALFDRYSPGPNVANLSFQLLTSPRRLVPLDEALNRQLYPGGAYTDSSGLWWPGKQGLWLYRHDIGLVRMADLPRWDWVIVAGACT